MKLTRVFVPAVLLLLGTGEAQEPTFTSNTNLVIIDANVRDKSGKVIPDLQKGDFTILEDGKPQQISVFEFQKLEGDVSLPAVPAVKPVNSTQPAAARPATPRGAPSPSTPEPVIRYQDRRLVAMLFDFSTMAIPEQNRIQQAALKFVREQMKPADIVAILSASTGPLKIVQDFTDDKDRLEQVIKTFQIGAASELAGVSGNGGDDTTGADDGSAFNADETEFNIFNTDKQLATLENAAKMLAPFPEKKALLYFSSGISKSGFDNQASLDSAVNAAKRSNVAFYPIDARGLVASAPAGDASAAASRGTSTLTGRQQQGQRDKFNDSQETLSTLAEDTGGKLFVDDNDLALGMEKARDDISSYYIIGYYSTNGKLDGKYRHVEVKLSKAVQAKIDYRSGYFGEKSFAKFTATDKENQLQSALMLGDPITDLPLSGEIDYFRLARERYFVPFAIKIPGAEIALAKAKGNAQTEFDFIAQVRDEHSKIVSVVRDGIKIKLSEQSAAELASHAIAYDTGFTLPPGKYTVKFLARENETGKMGTYETKFVIPDLAPVSSGLKLSSVVWSNQRQPLNESLASADNKKKLLDADPLVQGGQKTIPSITHVFRKDQNIYVYLEVYDPAIDPAQQKPSVSATLSFYRGKTKTFESEPVRLDEFAQKRAQTLPLKFQAPLSKLAAGRYTCQVNIVDEAGRKFGFQRTEIVILPSQTARKPAGGF
ncbi:MAG TPA: VWA domain-containing protein [Bryobacteraceae bacterium]|jgi:VWFA-related protein|nr:VWA domain-containing protein [Bryobacteraceae bacterium]